MKVKEAMSQGVCIATPDQTIQDAAKMMCENDIGILPIGENDRLVGMITDRDIAVRAVAQGKAPQTKLRDVMSAEVRYCYENDDAADVARNLADEQIRRLPVVNLQKRLVGMLSLCDLVTQDGQSAYVALTGISRAGGPHSQAETRS